MQGGVGFVMRRGGWAAGLGLVLALGACQSDKEVVAPVEVATVRDDCALIAAVAKQHYKLNASGSALRVHLNGEDAAWAPGCDWKALGFNFVDQPGNAAPEGAANLAVVTFSRPRFDERGVDVRTSMQPVGGEPNYELCRLQGGGGAWSLDACGPDPWRTEPRAAAPSPADTTPAKVPAPLTNDRLPPVNVTNDPPDPGRP